MNKAHARQLIADITPYQLFMLALCLWALMTLSAGTFFRLDPSTQTILDSADTIVCGLFFLDFLYSLYRAPRLIADSERLRVRLLNSGRDERILRLTCCHAHLMRSSRRLLLITKAGLLHTPSICSI